ncbi:protein phosphatase CheZ [Thiorhodovibrio frisius]|uniref:Protein phosphatase CheZ n=1 Tax=Thiorhodovibrio frisius TaxID=631362 RepID=H8YZM9_9GAMM|nr:protein phosphatase CheZ [Thiorhodovibrio frisius]EIC22156.1 chemotaxis protein [Thiorhodovibrio frisius]WPL24450.1 chemotaxis regulator CheZ [Thiorhodovibrio frisius]
MSTQQDAEQTLQLELARLLIEQLESGQIDAAGLTIQRLGAPYERELFEELGRLTRELHDTLRSFRDDSRLLELTRADFPDAKERLNHVITMTEQATHRTLNAVEEGLPIAEALHAKSARFAESWAKFRGRELDVTQFRELTLELDEFLRDATDETKRMGHLMSEIMMAQDFQDLTGQIIARVIRLVQEVEDSLVGLVRLSGERLEPEKIQSADAAASAKSAASAKTADDQLAAQGPAVPNTKDTEADVVASQDDVDALLSSLGF